MKENTPSRSQLPGSTNGRVEERTADKRKSTHSNKTTTPQGGGKRKKKRKSGKQRKSLTTGEKTIPLQRVKGRKTEGKAAKGKRKKTEPGLSIPSREKKEVYGAIESGLSFWEKEKRKEFAVRCCSGGGGWKYKLGKR